MLESNKVTSGTNSETSGSEIESSATSGASNDSDTMPKVLEKALKEKQNTAKKNLELQAELEAFRAKDRAREEQDLLAKNQHLKVIELREQEVKQLKEKLNNYETREVEGKKSLAILSELKKLGFVDNDINRELALKVFDKNQVEIDPSSQTVLGADLAAKAFYEKYNQIGVFGKKQVGTNHNATIGEFTGINSYIDELKNCKTQKEFDEIRKKYNKI